jgi:hypothetical protein
MITTQITTVIIEPQNTASPFIAIPYRLPCQLSTSGTMMVEKLLVDCWHRLLTTAKPMNIDSKLLNIVF